MSSGLSLRALLLGLPLGVAILLGTRSAHTLAASDPSSARVHVTVHDERGTPLVARVRVRAARLTERLRMARAHTDMAIASEHGSEVALQPGAYELFVSHGPEWSVARVSLALTAGEVLRKHIVLRHEVSLAGWHAAYLHVHTPHSDDARTRGGVHARDLQAEGVELSAITDHNHIGALGEGESVAGAEITTWAPEFGHFNAFPLSQLPTWRGSSPEALLRELTRDPKVYVQVNHPLLEHHIGYFALGEFDGARFGQPGFGLSMHGIELWNGYDLHRPRAVQGLLSEWRALLAQGHRLTATGGSDSHGRLGHLAGYPRTYVPTQEADALAPQLKGGHAFVTNGPLIGLRVNGKGVGEHAELSTDGTVRAELTVLAPSWLKVERVELWADQERVYQAELPQPAPGKALRFRRTVRVRPTDARSLHAVALDGEGLELLLGRSDVTPLAFTNPVYLAGGESAKLAGQHTRAHAALPQ